MSELSSLPLHRLGGDGYKRPKKTLTDTLQDEDIIQQKLEDHTEIDEIDIDSIPIGSYVKYIKWDTKNNCERFITGGSIFRIYQEYIIIKGKDNGTFSAQRYTYDKSGNKIHTTRFFKQKSIEDILKLQIIEIQKKSSKIIKNLENKLLEKENEIKHLNEFIRKIKK